MFRYYLVVVNLGTLWPFVSSLIGHGHCIALSVGRLCSGCALLLTAAVTCAWCLLTLSKNACDRGPRTAGERDRDKREVATNVYVVCVVFMRVRGMHMAQLMNAEPYTRICKQMQEKSKT